MEAEDREKLDELLDLNEGLTSFEVSFIDDLSHQTYPLTDAQRSKLDQIYRERVLGER